MEQAARGRNTLGLILGGLALGLGSALACLAEPGAARQVSLYWTDPGSRPAPGQTESLIQPFGDAVVPVFGKIDRQRGTLLIAMPKGGDLPTTDAEWAAFADRLAQGMRDKIQKGLQEGVASFEIRTVQQPQSVPFTEAFLTALDKVKQELARTGQVRAFGLIGCDGALAATESIPALRRSPLDHLVVVNGKATVERAVQTSAAMNGQLTLIVTPSGAASVDSVATLKGAQEAQRRDPRIRVLSVEPAAQAADVSAAASYDPLTQHDERVTMKEFTRKNSEAPIEIKELPVTTMADQLGAVLGVANNQVLIPYGVAMGMKVAPDSFKQEKGGELDKLRKEVIESRPQKGSATSPVPEKGGGN